LSAPRGNLAIGGAISATVNSFENYGTFIHNNGTVTFDATVDYGQRIQETASAATAFYNLTHNRSASSYHLYIKGDITVENILLNQVGFVNLYGPNTLTMGTTSSAGAITMTSSGIRFYNNDSSNYAKIYGASSIYPFVYTGNEPDIDTYSSNASHVAFKNGDIQVAMTGDYQGGIVRLDGDMEFDAVTVNGGDTLDLNGQRMECSGEFTNSGTVDNTGNGVAFIYAGDFNLDGAYSNDDNLKLILQPSGNVNVDFNDSDLASTAYRMINAGSHTVTQENNWTNNCGHFNVASGTCTLAYATSTNDLIVATGATLNSGGQAITVAGDFTTSGGLIGKSAGEFVTDDGTTNHNYITAGSSANSDGWTNLTVEAWVKMDHLGHQSSEATFFSRGSNSNPKFGLMDGKLRLYSGYGNLLGNTAITTGKWFHVACSYNSSGVAKLYIDGKLDAQATIADNLLSATSDVGASMIGAQQTGSRAMDGVMGKISIWNHELTEAEIRKLMFMTGAEMQADNTNFPDATANDCKFFYNFDEGTGSTIADSGPGGNNGTWAHNNSGTAAVWAGSGTFTISTSTLVMSGTSKKIIFTGNENVGNLQISGTTTLEEINGNDGYLQFNGTLTVDASKTLSSTSGERLIFNSSSDTIVINNAATGLSGLYSLEAFHTSGTVSLPACTTSRLKCYDGGTTQATGDITTTEELEVNSGTTFNANGNTIASRIVDINSGTLDLRNSTLNFSVSSSSDQLNMNSDSIMLSGNTAINGHSSATKTLCVTHSQAGIEVVGDVKHMVLDTDSDLTVIGSVIGCDVSASGANIRQFFHTLDTQQLLDADEAGDDDLRLEKPALDNANELQTG